jgi:hypothetical protein
MQVWSLLGAAGLLEDDWRIHAANGLPQEDDGHQMECGLFPEIIVVGFSKARMPCDCCMCLL